MSGLIRSRALCIAVHPLNFRPPHTSTLTSRSSSISHHSISIQFPVIVQPAPYPDHHAGLYFRILRLLRVPGVFHVYLHQGPRRW